jgi:hypothetical protein
MSDFKYETLNLYHCQREIKTTDESLNFKVIISD